MGAAISACGGGNPPWALRKAKGVPFSRLSSLAPMARAT